ncbi:Rieske 2Fe-2S domain-containing protein [Fulvimarina sp. MAC3]|uniref:Rieske 2Fe-2S domain-containing protein n=1 Tax=Fulvimarina sp. MAC3 TaxID=3148887 RepID=UPI0031FBE302
MALKEVEVGPGRHVLVEIPHENQRLVVSIDAGRVRVASDKCRHRGGPLHLCYRDKDNVRRCPWHDRRVLRDESYDGICATYFASRGLLRLVADYPEGLPWPIRVVSGPGPGAEVGQTV